MCFNNGNNEKPEQNTKEQPYGKDYSTDCRKFHQKNFRKYKQREKLEEIEPVLLKNCKETAVKIVEEYIAVLDKEILSDKELRKKCGYSVERKTTGVRYTQA